MQISSLSVMVGPPKCNLRCPYCISKMTYRLEREFPTLTTERLSLLTDAYIERSSGNRYGIITGKGEPTLAPMEEVGRVVRVLHDKGITPELQTNGTLLNQKNMGHWREQGLHTLALSCVSHLDVVNSRILSQDKVSWDLAAIIHQAREFGYLVRLTAVLTKGGIDSPDSFLAFMRWAKEAGAQQVTFRNMGKPRNLALAGSKRIAAWIDRNYVDPAFIVQGLRKIGEEGESWPWAYRFDVEGISVVVTDGMNPPEDGIVRHAVIQPDGHLYGSWDDPSDIII